LFLFHHLARGKKARHALRQNGSACCAGAPCSVRFGLRRGASGVDDSARRGGRRESASGDHTGIFGYARRRIPSWQVAEPAREFPADRRGCEKKKFADEADVAVKNIKIGGDDGNHHVHYTLESKNLARLFELCELPNMNLDKDSQGNYTLWTKRKVAQKQTRTPEEQLEEDEMRRAAQKMFKGLKLSLKIIVPGDILETTAHARTTTCALWSFDLEKDATFLDEEPEIRLKFRGQGVQLREIRALGPDEVAE
jgi:hypothetical protein